MRLRLKLVLVTTALTFGIVLVLSAVFMTEILRQRVEQTAAQNDVLAHQVFLATQKALENGLKANPPKDTSDEAFRNATIDALRADQPLADLMDSIVRYSPTVQDVSITDQRRAVLAASDPVMLSQTAPYRTLLSSVRDASILDQAKVVFGAPQVLDIPLSLERNHQPFLVVHLGVRSTLLRNSYAPLLRASILFSAFAILGCIIAAALLSTVALRPIEEINRRLESLENENDPISPAQEAEAEKEDAVVRAAGTIERLGRKIRISEEQQTRLQTNLNQMLNTLKDGVLLFNSEDCAVMASDAVFNILNLDRDRILNTTVHDIFNKDSALDRRVRLAFETRQGVADEPVTLANGRTVELSIAFIDNNSGDSSLGALLTLHDAETELELQQEIEISRRLAAIGRLTAGVGHEVKNPINAMVVHLELLRSKLNDDRSSNGALRHVEILSSEMQRLDRVVQTLADFSRPLELQLRDSDLNTTVRSVVELATEEMDRNGVYLDFRPSASAPVRIDTDLIKQALLNILLNAVQAMPQGGDLHVHVHTDAHTAIITIRDHGVGIPAEAQQRIFDLYFTTKPRGSGIGLAMTYRIVQLHGGAISFRSNNDLNSADHGTEFTVRLPLAHKLITSPQTTDTSRA